MGDSKLEAIVDRLEKNRLEALKAVTESDVARHRIVDEIALHRRQLADPSGSDSVAPATEVFLQAARFQVRLRLQDQLARLEDLLQRYDREQHAALVDALEQATAKVSAVKRIARQRAHEARRTLARKDLALMTEVGLLRWWQREGQ